MHIRGRSAQSAMAGPEGHSEHTLPALESSRASGSSSANTIHSMQPAAKPSAIGSNDLKVSTNTKDGKASRGCGMDVKIVHQKACRADIPFATSTVATARPSGMLCRPIANVTSKPCEASQAEHIQMLQGICLQVGVALKFSMECLPMGGKLVASQRSWALTAIQHEICDRASDPSDGENKLLPKPHVCC